MNMKLTPALVRATIFFPVILLGLMVAPAGFLAGLIGGIPNQFTMLFVDQWLLFKVLWASNLEAAIPVFMQQPLMVVARSEPSSGLATWRLFFYPVPLAVQLAVSIFASVILCSGAHGTALRRLVLLLPGIVTLVFVTTHVQVATCCTGGPRWALDIWLFSLAYDPLSTLIDWNQLYLRIEGIFPIMQAALALLGVAFLVAGARRAREVKARR